MKLTILTPTYNRADKLKTLYESLKNQTNKEFIWHIIDDGSMDNTKQVIENFNKENILKIKYQYKSNGGKHKAVNYAIKNIKTKITFIVDSDDYLTEDAIETILDYDKKYQTNKDICGFSFLIAYPDGTINNKKYLLDESIDSYIDSRINSNISGDKAQVYYTKILKEYPFPEYENEKFISEDIVWIEISLKYKLVNINKVIYIAEYLDDGLTKNGRKIKLCNPKGMFERAKKWMYKDIKLKYKMKGIIMYIIYGHILNYKLKELKEELKTNSNIMINPFLIDLMYLPSLCIYQKWKIDKNK